MFLSKQVFFPFEESLEEESLSAERQDGVNSPFKAENMPTLACCCLASARGRIGRAVPGENFRPSLARRFVCVIMAERRRGERNRRNCRARARKRDFLENLFGLNFRWFIRKGVWKKLAWFFGRWEVHFGLNRIEQQTDLKKIYQTGRLISTGARR